MERVRDALVRTASLIRWTARLWGAAAALLLLAFFVEHLEWLRGAERLPPASVIVGMGFHLLALIGLVVAWRWEVPGASLTLAGAIGFLLAVGGGARLLPILGAIPGPAFLWLLCGWLRHRLLHEARAVP